MGTPKIEINVKLPLAAALLVSQLAAAAPCAEDFVAEPRAHDFILMERTPSGGLLEGIEESTVPASSLLEEEPSFEYSREKWNEVIEKMEKGDLYEPAVRRAEEETAVSTETPRQPEPEVEFKSYGTSLSVTGRKTISLGYSGKTYLNEQTTVSRPKSYGMLEINQQLQVRMQGKVGDKITVNVDYDDSKEDKQDISVVYTGDSQEVVQNVSFGDINLSLPSTEFVSYNKQLFGIRADLKTHKLSMTFIGSRTKGQTKTKQFTGNTQFRTADIQDINYIRRRYYDATFQNSSRLPIKQGSERIYIDRQEGEVADGVTIFNMTAEDLEVQTSAYTGKFRLLNPGVDYVIDYVKGIITFSRTLNTQDVVIVDFTNSNGTMLSENSSASLLDTASANKRYKILKTQNDIYISTASEVGYNRELKTYYSIGQINIVRDNGQGNFTLKVQDLNRNDVGSSIGKVYPGSIHVDFEQGIFYLDEQFKLDGEPDPQVYSASPVSKRIFRVEYFYRFKTFMLEPSIVPRSETVMLNGNKINRNESYFIDYDSGFITFYYPEKIGSDAKIVITYEVSPFGGTGSESLLGSRVSYDLTKHVSLGSTLLYQGGFKSNTVPNITDIVGNMLVYEGDVQFKNLNFFGIKASLSAEGAQSRANPNLNDYALVDNMEGVEQEDSPSMDKHYWQIAANPTLGAADPAAIEWANEDVKLEEINPQTDSEGDQSVLVLNYDFSVSSEVSVVYPLSNAGLDFSGKNVFEIVVYGENSPSFPGPRLNFHLGQINEDADGSGGQNFTCSNGTNLLNAPKSEDINCDGQVSSKEDTGWLYAPPGKSSRRYGAGNGRLDTADLNGNGRLDSQDFTGGSFGYVSGIGFIDNNDSGNSKEKVDFSGWHNLYASMNISSSETYKWNAVKQVRISLKQSPGGATKGTIKIARISAVGNTWNVNQGTDPVKSLDVVAVNNLDNPGYTPIYDEGGEASAVYEDLYGSPSEQKRQTGSDVISEQTLSINYSSIVSTSSNYVYRRFSRPVDISQHRKFKFLLKNLAVDGGATFYMKIGDENTYQKISVPLNFMGWRLISLRQEDVNGDSIPDIWVNDTAYPDVAVSSANVVSFQQVPMIIMGIETSDSDAHSGTVYVNEIHLSESVVKKGNAKKAQADFEIPGWMSFGGKHRYVDKNFQTPVMAVTNQDNERNSAYLKFTRLRFLPMNFDFTRQITQTPNVLVTGTNNLLNSLQQGKVKKLDANAGASLNISRLPSVGFNYSKNETDYVSIHRFDEKDSYSSSLQYNVPFKVFFLPGSVNLNYGYSENRVDYDAEKLTDLSGLYNVNEKTRDYGAKLTFLPWRGSSLNPSYSLQVVQEEKHPLSSPGETLKYDKSMRQTASLNANFRFASWLNPSLNYSVTTLENNNLNVTTATVLQSSPTFSVGDIKTVNRNSQGAVSLTLNMNRLLPKSKLLRSLILSSNYQLQDGDSWEFVEKGYDTKKEMWIRTPLEPAGEAARRNSLTVRDTYNSTQRWQPFEAYSFGKRLAPLSTLSLTNNFTSTFQKTDNTGTRSVTKTRTFPDLLLSMSKLEMLTKTGKWASNAVLNLKFSRSVSETKSINEEYTNNYGLDLRFRFLDFMDSVISCNGRYTEKKDLRLNRVLSETVRRDASLQGSFQYRQIRLTPKIDYSRDFSENGLGVTTQDDTVITPGVSSRMDVSLPKGIKLPFMIEPIKFSNRIVWSNNLSYTIKKSPIVIANNSRLLNFTSSADYEATKNLRVTLNVSFQRFWHKYLAQEEYYAYQIGSTVALQF